MTESHKSGIEELRRRWRMVSGSQGKDGEPELSPGDAEVDNLLTTLIDEHMKGGGFQSRKEEIEARRREMNGEGEGEDNGEGKGEGKGAYSEGGEVGQGKPGSKTGSNGSNGTNGAKRKTGKSGSGKKKGKGKSGSRNTKADHANYSEDAGYGQGNGGNRHNNYGSEGSEGSDGESKRREGSGGESNPQISEFVRLLDSMPEDARSYMIVRTMEEVGIGEVLRSEELADNLEPNIDLVSKLVELKDAIRDDETAIRNMRIIIRRLADDMQRLLKGPVEQAIRGALRSHERTNRPRLADMDFDRTIRKNLKNYDKDRNLLIADQFIGNRRRSNGVKDRLVIAIDQSGSMAQSVVFTGIFGGILCSIPAIETYVVAFDTSTINLTEEVRRDAVEMIFAAQLGGGTDINRAMAMIQQNYIAEPGKTTVILISDLMEGGDFDASSGHYKFIQRCASMKQSGVNVIALLALSEEGKPWYDAQNARELHALEIPVFACTPQQFPEVMGAAISRQSLSHFVNESMWGQ